MSKRLSAETLLVQANRQETFHRSLCAPIVQSTTYVQQEIGQTGNHAYSRVSNPTVDELEYRLGELESAHPAVCCSTGLAAESTLFFSLLRTGDHLICGRAVYGGTTRLLQQLLQPLGVNITLVDSSDVTKVQAAILPNTRLIFLESPANPTLELSDIQSISRMAHAQGIVVAVDNTFLTPLGQHPLELGADVSVYSTTKLIDGHSAALGGALIAHDAGLVDRFKFVRKSLGCIQTPHNAWLTLQGLKTLSIRTQVQFRNAHRVAKWLERRSSIIRVNYPGLASFAQSDIANFQHLIGHGNVISFELAGGYQSARRFVKSLKLCRLVEHVGSVETLITHSASMTHADVPVEMRRAAGISDGLLRLSVGVERFEDLVSDLASGLRRLARWELSRNRPKVPSLEQETKTCEINV